MGNWRQVPAQARFKANLFFSDTFFESQYFLQKSKTCDKASNFFFNSTNFFVRSDVGLKHFCLTESFQKEVKIILLLNNEFPMT